jgi:hypothetical protein
MTLTALVIAACGGGDTAGEDPEPTVPEGTDGGVILEISDEGGFVPVEFNLTRVPRFTVFSDGTVVTPTGQQFTFPGPALVPLEERNLDEATLSDLLAFVDDLGLAELDAVDLSDAPNVADASTTVLRYFDAGGEHRISIYALGFGESGDARAAIVESMIARLDAAVESTAGTPYGPERIVLFSQTAGDFDPEMARDGGPWPLAISPDEMTGDSAGFACLTLEGAAAAEAITVLEEADSFTLWDFGGTDFRLLARPLLPHQDGC